ncbi:MAG: four helix bundle protein, partial [Candidatus Rokuibacteriota bacterium]
SGGRRPPDLCLVAQAEHLPIYKRSYDLCLYLEPVVRSFSRYHKYTLGADLRDGARRVLKLIVRANAHRDKVPLLLEVREEVEQLKALTPMPSARCGGSIVAAAATSGTPTMRSRSR